MHSSHRCSVIQFSSTVSTRRFAGLLGKILSEMAVDGRTQYDVTPFTMDREALKDPNYKPVFFMGTSKLPSSIKTQQPDKAKL